MKRISLERLTLHNFKGIRDFILEANGDNVKVYGDNAQGKTTIFDAFTWLLFDKDSQNKKDFEIKTLDARGNVLHNLNHEVEGTFLIDGMKITLRKIFSEKWTKKRGSATSEFTGHTTDYYIDGVPAKKNEYTKRVGDIISEDIFKLLTSPTYFNEQMKWQDRREILMEVCGDLSDKEVIESNKELAKLPSILKGRSIEDHKKVLQAKKTEVNKEIEKIPVRIDEVHRSTPIISTGKNKKETQQQIDVLKEQISEKEAECIRIQSGGEISEKEKKLREAESELLHIKNNLQSGTMDKISAKQRELSNLRNQYNDLQHRINDKKWTVKRNDQKIADLQGEASRLRQKWHEVNGEQFEQCHDENCPTCGQALPEEQVQKAHEKALTRFNRDKAERLENIVLGGKSVTNEVNKLETENISFTSEIDSLNEQFASKSKKLSVIENELDALQCIVDLTADPQYKEKMNEVSTIKADIEQLRVSTQEATSKVKQDISALKIQVEPLEKVLHEFEMVRYSQDRIQELADREKELATIYEQLEFELFLIENFIRTKVDLLTEKINQKFKLARFRLFENQINGGLAEVCETTYDGVPYSGGLNNAMRINVGLDIINTLSDHYGFSAPIFVDNAEAVTKLIDTNSQVISLIVNEQDKQLRVETQTTMREAI